jgi:hypothetical protein
MNKLHKSALGAFMGISLASLVLTASGCGGPSARELQLEQQLANYQKKDLQIQQNKAIADAVKAGVEDAYKNQVPDPQISAFYTKVSGDISNLNEKVAKVQEDVNAAKTAQSNLETAITGQNPTPTPYVIPYPGSCVSPTIYSNRLINKTSYTIPAMSLQQLVDRLDCYSLEEFNNILRNPFGNSAKLREKSDRVSGNGEINRIVVGNGTYGGSVEIHYQNEGGAPLSVLKMLIDTSRLDNFLSNPNIFPRALYEDVFSKAQ